MNNETLTEHLFEVSERLSKIEALGGQILGQTTKTNGRVTSLEGTTADLAKIISRHNGDLERNQEEFRLIRENHSAMKSVFETERDRVLEVLEDWRAERDAVYAEERKAREKREEAAEKLRADKEKEWRAFILKTLGAVVTILGGLILTKLGIDVAEVQQLTVPLQ